MKKMFIIIGLISVFVIKTVPAFSSSLKFDFDGDEVWDNEWPMTIGETVEVDVWLDGYTGPNITTVIYEFEWDQASIEITDAWPNDADNGGPWDPSFLYAHIDSGGQYWYRVGSGPIISEGIPVDNKIKLHTIVIKRLTDDNGEIETQKPAALSGDIFLGPAGVQQNIGSHAHAEIHVPLDCELTIIPVSENVFTWETVQFSTTVDGTCFDPDPEPSCYTWEISLQGSTGSNIDDNGLYTAGGDEGTDIITVTDTCNYDIVNTATVNVVTTTTTTTTSVGPGPRPTTTTTVKDIDDPCITDKSCNDGIFCNGEERCYRGVYSWSAGAAGSTGDAGNTGTELGSCQRGEEPCPDDGLYCTGEISCDEENEICLSTGDPCEPEGLVCDEKDDICRPPAECVDDEDCDDDGLFCNGDEICVDGSCGHSGDPCPEGTTCVEETDQCATTVAPEDITLSPDPMMRSRWIMLPTLVVITGEETNFSKLTSQVSYSPSTALLPMPALVLGPEIIWQLVFVNPSWLAGFPADPQTVTVTVDNAVDDFKIQLLPFILDEKKDVLK